MRPDAIIDKRQVPCKNASKLGFDKFTAQVGDFIVYTDGHAVHNGRMIGRVHYAPALEGDRTPVKDWILAVVLSEDLTFTMERWINPVNVIRVQAPRDHARVLAWFTSDLMTDAPVEEVRKSTSDGWSTLEAFRAWKAKNAQQEAEYESRRKAEVTA